jgi:hypothetical protein
MIKPPFTILVLKDSHQPVTIRITRKFVLIFLTTFLIVACIIALVGAFWGISLTKGGAKVFSDLTMKSKTLKYVLVDEKEKNNSSGTAIKPDIKDLSILQTASGSIDLTFGFKNIGEDKDLFVWLIINAEAEKSGDILVYPRSPLFRGFPVDYRNGILHSPKEGKYLKVTFAGPAAGIEVKNLRIIVYTIDGSMILNNLMSVENIKM